MRPLDLLTHNRQTHQVQTSKHLTKMEATLNIICEIVDVVVRQIDDDTQFDDVGYDMDRLEQMVKGETVPAAVSEAYSALFREVYASKGCMCEVVSELVALKQAAQQELSKL